LKGVKAIKREELFIIVMGLI